jgi:hypothetical protein
MLVADAVINAVAYDSITRHLSTEDQTLSPLSLTVEEFLHDERAYLAQMGKITEVHKQFKSYTLLPGNTVQEIFGQASRLIEIQQRFILKAEMVALRPQRRQNWGMAFKELTDHADVLAYFIATQKKTEETIRTILSRQRTLKGEDRQTVQSLLTLTVTILSLPAQRLPKYSAFHQVLSELDILW